ncbi:hypothetical protein LCGC14_1706170 [marine sediment metagenome]|uniref:Uncharacterized protein n=1 Tax=marine sediment metagenome TaxID=412755 RepID=A0A0F9JWZ7_9ZZZZ
MNKKIMFSIIGIFIVVSVSVMFFINSKEVTNNIIINVEDNVIQETIREIEEREEYESKRKLTVDMNDLDIKKCDSGILKCDRINGCVEKC